MFLQTKQYAVKREFPEDRRLSVNLLNINDYSHEIEP